MTKLMLATHGDDVAPALLGPDLRQALASAGATALQVNVDDENVAPAMRLHAAQPVSAVLSVWTDGPSTPIVDAVAEAVGAQPYAYRVTEVVRLDPRPVPDGERAEVLANIALLRRPSDMSREDYLDYWMLHHTAVAIRTQNTEAYVQNIVEEVLTDSPEYRDLFDKVLDYARETVRTDDGELTKRVKWWSALALLRALASSPRAAAQTLRTRAASAAAESPDEADAIGRAVVLDQADDEAIEAADTTPGAATESD